jgi:hypothetical protein
MPDHHILIVGSGFAGNYVGVPAVEPARDADRVAA